jgi:hypothetical protein
VTEIGAAFEDPNLLGRYFGADSWRNWRTILRGGNAEPLTRDEAAFFKSVTDRAPPRKRMREIWAIVGQRGGKGSVVSGLAAHAAASFEAAGRLRPGEVATIAICAVDKAQAGIVKDYIGAYFHEVPALKSFKSWRRIFGRSGAATFFAGLWTRLRICLRTSTRADLTLKPIGRCGSA